MNWMLKMSEFFVHVSGQPPHDFSCGFDRELSNGEWRVTLKSAQLRNQTNLFNDDHDLILKVWKEMTYEFRTKDLKLYVLLKDNKNMPITHREYSIDSTGDEVKKIVSVLNYELLHESKFDKLTTFYTEDRTLETEIQTAVRTLLSDLEIAPTKGMLVSQHVENLDVLASIKIYQLKTYVKKMNQNIFNGNECVAFLNQLRHQRTLRFALEDDNRLKVTTFSSTMHSVEMTNGLAKLLGFYNSTITKQGEVGDVPFAQKRKISLLYVYCNFTQPTLFPSNSMKSLLRIVSVPQNTMGDYLSIDCEDIYIPVSVNRLNNLQFTVLDQYDQNFNQPNDAPISFLLHFKKV